MELNEPVDQAGVLPDELRQKLRRDSYLGGVVKTIGRLLEALLRPGGSALESLLGLGHVVLVAHLLLRLDNFLSTFDFQFTIHV